MWGSECAHTSAQADEEEHRLIACNAFSSLQHGVTGAGFQSFSFTGGSSGRDFASNLGELVPDSWCQTESFCTVSLDFDFIEAACVWCFHPKLLAWPCHMLLGNREDSISARMIQWNVNRSCSWQQKLVCAKIFSFLKFPGLLLNSLTTFLRWHQHHFHEAIMDCRGLQFLDISDEVIHSWTFLTQIESVPPCNLM